MVSDTWHEDLGHNDICRTQGKPCVKIHANGESCINGRCVRRRREEHKRKGEGKRKGRERKERKEKKTKSVKPRKI